MNYVVLLRPILLQWHYCTQLENWRHLLLISMNILNICVTLVDGIKHSIRCSLTKTKLVMGVVDFTKNKLVS